MSLTIRIVFYEGNVRISGQSNIQKTANWFKKQAQGVLKFSSWIRSKCLVDTLPESLEPIFVVVDAIVVIVVVVVVVIIVVVVGNT